MDERLRFVARLLEGEKMAPLCREFGISRVTGYKIFDRYKECGLDGLHDRSKAPYRQANKLPFQVERAILGIKKELPTWGAPKIRDKLIREYPMIPPPAVSTIHAALGGAYPAEIHTGEGPWTARAHRTIDMRTFSYGGHPRIDASAGRLDSNAIEAYSQKARKLRERLGEPEGHRNGPLGPGVAHALFVIHTASPKGHSSS
jgi:hypothetical protein